MGGNRDVNFPGGRWFFLRRCAVLRVGSARQRVCLPLADRFPRSQGGRRAGIIRIAGWLLRVSCRHGHKKEKRGAGWRAPQSFPSNKMRFGSVPHVRSTDCGQGLKGCKAGKQRSSQFVASRVRLAAKQRSPCNPTTTYCIFSLDTTRPSAHTPAKFFREFQAQGTGAARCSRPAATAKPGRLPASGKSSASFQRGRKSAVFAGMDRSVHQSGVRRPRPLAAGR